MKINVEVECSPEEFRRLMGLPDLTPVHERFVAALGGMVEGRVQPEMIEAMMRSWSPMSEAGLGMWRKLLEANTLKT